MALRNTNVDYGALARALHWIAAIGIFWLIYLGLEQAGMERGPEKMAVRATHASWALLVLVLMTIRIVWRFMNETPEHPAGMPGWQKMSATVTHWAIYVAVFFQLIAGAMTVATNGNGLPFFGMTISVPVAENQDAHEFWEGIHEFAWKPLAALLVLHVLASLYNHFVAKNDVFRRMTVGLKQDD
jgi:cytochrome b561